MSARNLVPGTIFDRRYVIARALGSGYTAVVYEGTRLEDRRRVVLRFVHASLAGYDGYVEMFLGAMEKYRGVRGDCVVELVDAGQTARGTLFAATELVEARCVPGTPLPWPRAAAIMERLCRAFDLLEAAGVSDRRIATSKIYLPDDRAKLDVVGLLVQGRVMPEPDEEAHIRPWWPGITVNATWMAYASPEGLMGKPRDARNDVYILGVVAYELVTGRRPFADAVGPAGLITKQIKERPVPPSQCGASAAADAVILRCLEKAPGDRFADRTALREALASV
jgi:serine/threonine-protein kinase